MMAERRQMIIVAVLVGLLVVLFFVGVGFGTTHHGATDTVDSWRNRLSGLDPATTLDPAQLTTVGCSIDDAAAQLKQLNITGDCQVEIPATADRFALRGRRLILALPADTPRGLSVTVEIDIGNQPFSSTISAGDTTKIGFGRGGAYFHVTCNPSPPCVVDLPPR